VALARQAERGFPQTAMTISLAAVASVMLAISAFVALDPMGLRAPVASGYHPRPAVMESGRQWEIQRRQQLGYGNPVLDSGRDWEEQRRQQSSSANAVLDSGRDWEEQRRQQSAD